MWGSGKSPYLSRLPGLDFARAGWCFARYEHPIQSDPSLVAHLLKVAGAIHLMNNRRGRHRRATAFSFVLCGVPPASFVRGPDEQDPFFPSPEERIPDGPRPRCGPFRRAFYRRNGAGPADRPAGYPPRRCAVLGHHCAGRYESFDLGFSDPPLRLESTGTDFFIEALNARGKVLVAFLAETLKEPCAVITEKSATRISGHIVRGDAPVDEDQRTRRASVVSLVRDIIAAFNSPSDGLLGLFGAFALRPRVPVRRPRTEACARKRSARYRSLHSRSHSGLRPRHRARRDPEL